MKHREFGWTKNIHMFNGTLVVGKPDTVSRPISQCTFLEQATSCYSIFIDLMNPLSQPLLIHFKTKLQFVAAVCSIVHGEA